VAGLLLVAACDPEPGPGDAVGVSSDPIVNGTFTSQFPSAGALLVGSDPDTAGIQCTGTLVGCDTFLTAAHCVCDTVGADCQSPTPAAPFQVFLQHAGFFEVASVAVHPSYSFPDADVAVLTLAEPVTGVTPTPLQDTAPALGTRGTLVGFGRTGGANNVYGLKYTGGITTGACPDDIDATGKVCWTYDGAPDSNTCNGDSGGPLFFGEPGALRVGGITSGGTEGSCLEGDNSYDNSVYDFRTFINERAVGGLAQAACGSLPQVGQELVAVSSIEGALAAGGTRELAIDVPRGTTELRIGLNSADGGGANFDFTLARADGGGEACSSTGTGAYGFCVVDSPDAGGYVATVTAAGDAGDYQLTATAIGGGPVGADDAYSAAPDAELVLDAAAGVLANDEAPRGDLTAVLATTPANGSIELQADGSFRYTPLEGFLGTDSFSYEASDGTYTSTAVVTLTVEVGGGENGGGGGGNDIVGGCSAGGGGTGGTAAGLLALAALLGFALRRRA
jgi:MYXO-CTERM domain-containing protein